MSPERSCLEMVLLFHSPGPWDNDKLKQWARLQEPLLQIPGNGGMRDGMFEVTTRRLCDVVRATLEKPPK